MAWRVGIPQQERQCNQGKSHQQNILVKACRGETLAREGIRSQILQEWRTIPAGGEVKAAILEPASHVTV